ncbi:ATPase, T2SS/T4P/T4SS family (plasmid) [Paraburkholderia sp. D15]|uniref:ATPase, T2SS/T4P/T4SS family n=1 Tax=Paraburkholderia sp. D15 TaxID=2880218 RepID=UPI002478A211|nr:ATPase, T2SS/T4P/T4SS family [Paraburkholderia sp. D15]WGS55108.1 ATPase, T2SS/T4P/T4SS family [Paraburkholderia sp. D15]
MGMFTGTESEEPASRGFLGRLRGWRESFTDTGATTILPVSEPRFESESRAANPQLMTLGMRLRNGDVTDVEALDPDAIQWSTRARANAQPESACDERAASHATNAEFASAAHDNASPAADAASTPQQASDDVLRGRAHVSAQFGVPGEMSGIEAHDGSGEPTSMNAADTATSAEATSSAAYAREADPGAREKPPVRTGQQGKAEQAGEHTELLDAGVLYAQGGLPQLFSVEGLGPFKRILCEPGPDSTLQITIAARREFVAVDLQGGVAMVVATREFHESALYSTYLKDLARADIAIREEMVATADVVAGIYAAAKQREAKAVVPEASRAIGMFRDIVEAAHEFGASDEHWEYRDFNDEVEIRLRVDGDMYTYRRMPKAVVLRALSASYQDLVQRNTNSGETFQPSVSQSAMIPIVCRTDLLNLRWQSAPLVGGFDVALRLLDGNFRHVNVLMPSQMGLEASQLEIIDSLAGVSGGVTFLSGETGSAKSTLLRAMSYMMTSRDLRKQYAVSQPSEFPNPWLSEISLQQRPDESDAEASRKMAEVIRTLMRMDPDDLTVTEIRDQVVAALVAELALTGHPVRTTIHAKRMIGVFMRLVGGRLQLPMDEVSSDEFVNAAGYQKLIPLLCPRCKVPAADVMPAAQLELLRAKFGLDTSRMACRSEEGCEHCQRKGLFTRDGKVAGGTKGQTLAMELYRPTPEFLDRISVRDWRGAETVWRSERATGFGDADMTGKTIFEHALYKASTGIIDPRFIDRSMGGFAQYRVMPGRDGKMPS